MFNFYNKNFYKCGVTGDILSRQRQYSTYYPTKCNTLHISKIIAHSELAEDILFDRLRMYRYKSDREFFSCKLSIIKKEMDDICNLLLLYKNDNNNKNIIKKIIKNIPNFLITIINSNRDKYFKIFFDSINTVKIDYCCINVLDNLLIQPRKKINSIINKFTLKFDYNDNFIVDLDNFHNKINIIDFNLIDDNLKNKFLEPENNINMQQITNILVNHYNFENKSGISFITMIAKNLDNDHNIDLTFLEKNNVVNYLKRFYIKNIISIDFEVIVTWLNVQKYHLKRLLVNNFEENYDYIIDIIKIPHRYGASRKEQIFLTPNCFKELCMLSQTPKAKEVRKYFISIEKLIRKYHQYIQEKLYKKLNMLYKNQKPKININSGVIYILEALNSDTDLYKIGKTTNLRNRLNNYNSGNANDIEPIFILEVDDIDNVELCIKRTIKEFQYRKYKEIYEVDIDVLKQVMMRCDEFVNSMKKLVSKKKEFKKLDRLYDAENGLYLAIYPN